MTGLLGMGITPSRRKVEPLLMGGIQLREGVMASKWHALRAESGVPDVRTGRDGCDHDMADQGGQLTPGM